MTNCKTCPVSTGTHKPAEAVHQIDDPQAEALLELAAYRFTVANREARIAELEGQLEAIGAGGVEPLRKPAAAPQAVQAAVPIHELKAILADADIGPPVDTDWCCLECGQWTPWHHPEAHDHEDGCSAPSQYAQRRNWKARLSALIAAAPAHPAEGVPAQAVTKVQQTAPKVIYLNIGPDAEDYDFKDLCGVTWCDHDATYGSIQYVRADLAATQPAAQGVAEDAEVPEAVLDAVAAALGDAYDCGRVWSAWGVGTMSSDDFTLVADDGERVAEIARAALAAQAKQGGA